jgi:hypothetical protein
MLAKGEVEEIIVRPDMDIVTIILIDGAVVKARKVCMMFTSKSLLTYSIIFLGRAQDVSHEHC